MLWFALGCAVAAVVGVAWASLALLWRVRDTAYAADDVRFIVAGHHAELVQRKEAADRGWWVVLGIQPDASKEQVDLAYRSLLKAQHPDLNRRDGAGLDVQRLQRARIEAQLELRRKSWWAGRVGA